MKIPLFIPFVNRPDLLRKSFLSAARSMQVQPSIIDNSNGKEEIPAEARVFVLVPSVPLTFSQTQNWMLKLATEQATPFYAWMHSDAEAVEDSVDKIIELARQIQGEQQKWGAIFSNYDSLAVYNTAAFNAVGGWDTGLSWYLSDCDTYRRLRLAGYPTLESGLPVKHTPSQTLQSDPTIRRSVELEIPYREAYYRAKWGGPNEHEVYTAPFNERRERGARSN